MGSTTPNATPVKTVPLMMIERNVELIGPADAMRKIVSLIVQLFVDVCTLFLLIYF